MELIPSNQALDNLPTVIWFQPTSTNPLVYRGTPLQMVEVMATEIGTQGVRNTIEAVLQQISTQRNLLIRLPSDLDDETTAALFIHALLETRFGKPVPQA